MRLTEIHTYRTLKKKDVTQYNKENLMNEKIKNLTNGMKQELAEENLCLQSNINDFPSGSRNFDIENLNFSMNKKKRWLLPELLIKKASELKIKIKTNKDKINDDDINKMDFALIGIQFHKRVNRFRKNLSKYFDNFGRLIKAKHDLNGDSILAHVGFLHTRIRRQRRRNMHWHKKPIKTRRVYKNGNRNRNSGIKRRNENFLREENEPTRNVIHHHRALFSFWITETCLKSRKCWRTNISNCVDVDSEIECNVENENEYSNKVLINNVNIADILKVKTRIVEKKRRKNKQKQVILENEKFDKKVLIRKSGVPDEHNDDATKVLETVIYPEFINLTIKPSNIGNFIDIIEKNFVNQKFENEDYEICTNHLCFPIKILININKKLEKMFNTRKFEAIFILDYPIVCESGQIQISLNLNLSYNDHEVLKSKLEDSLKKINADDLIGYIDKASQQLSLKLREMHILEDSKILNNNLKVNLIGTFSYTDQTNLYIEYKNILNKKIITENDTLQNMNSSKMNLEKRQIICEICFDEQIWPDDFITLNRCGHMACKNCWKYYAKTKIENLKVTSSFTKNKENEISLINCAHEKCNNLIDLNTLSCFLNLKLVEKYSQFYADLKIFRSASYVFCSGVNCNKIIVIPSDNINNLTTICVCGYMVCNKCLKEAHFPALCSQMKKHLENMKNLNSVVKNSGDKLYTSEGKHCPKCDNYMEKNGGCNHMSCICGFQYCWKCLRDYYFFHTSSTGYTCNAKTDTELIKYDSSKFMGFSAHNYKKELQTIIIDQRRLRSDAYLIEKQNTTIKRFHRRISAHFFSVKTLKLSQRLNEFQKFNFILKLLDSKPILEIETYFNEEVNDFISAIRQLYFINEHLALLVAGSNNSLYLHGKYSFKINLIESLKKSVEYTKIGSKIIENGSTLDDFVKVQTLKKSIEIFMKNLKYFTIASLRLYDSKKIS